MSQIKSKFIANLAITTAKLASGAATSAQALFADGSGNAAYRSILSTDIPTLNQNTTGTAANITATSNATLTTLSALTTASSLAISGSQVSGGTFGAVNGSALTNLSAAALSGVLPVGVTGGSGLSIAATQLTGQVSIANGGTGQSTAAAAYNALSPMTTAGDLEYEASAGTAARLPIGTTGQVLTVVAGLPSWQTATSGANQALSNLSAVAINTSLLPGTDNSINLGSTSKSWASANIHSLLDASGNQVVLPYVYILQDAAGSNSINWNNRSFYDNTGATQGAWNTSGLTLNTALTLKGSTSGTFTQSASATTITYSVVWPAAQASGTQFLQNNGSGVLSWATPTLSPGSITLPQNDILVGNSSNVAAAVAMSGEASIVSSGAVTLSNSAVIGKVLTGYASTTGTISASDSILSAIEKLNGNQALYLPLTGGTMSGAINMGSNQINGLATPTSSTDAATKGYVDSAINGLTWKGPANAYAAVNVPLTGSTPLVVDGHTVVNGDLLLLGAQSTASQNGEYVATVSGGTYSLTANGQPSAAGDAWLILSGTAYANSAFVATAAVPAAAFTEFAGPTAYTFSAPLQLSGNTVSITQASGSTNGYLSSTDWNTFNNKQAAGNYITALTGDATASGPGSAALTLATVNTNVGSFGSSTSIPSFTVNAKGLITAASGNAVVAPAGTLSGTTLNSTVVSSSLTSVGTITTGVWNGTTIAIANGGTGQTSAAAAFAALSPLTTAGDIIYENATPAPARLGIGSTGQVLTVVGGLPAWQSPASTLTVTEENPSLSSTDITNQYYDLAHAVQGSSSSANSVTLSVVGGPEQQKTVDYTVALTGGVGGVTRISFSGDLATGGNAALVAGDVLQIRYAY